MSEPTHQIKFEVAERVDEDERGYPKFREEVALTIQVNGMQAAAVTAEVLKLLSDASLAE